MTGYRKQQSGVALIIGLLMLLLLTIIMVSAVQVTALEQRMAANLQNNNVAFQAAETALREAEAFILVNADRAAQSTTPDENPFYPLKLSYGPFQTSGCAEGICGPTQSDKFPHVDHEEGVSGLRSASTELQALSIDPGYIIELIGADPGGGAPPRWLATFKITARAGAGDNSVVQLQSTYQVKAPLVYK